MVVFTPEVQPTSVGSSGSVISIAISKGFEGYPVVKLETEHISGGATYSTVEFSTDNTFVDLNQRIATFEGLNKTSPVGHTNNKTYYPWDGVISGGVIYCRITAETEVDNNYFVRIHFDEEVKP